METIRHYLKKIRIDYQNEDMKLFYENEMQDVDEED